MVAMAMFRCQLGRIPATAVQAVSRKFCTVHLRPPPPSVSFGSNAGKLTPQLLEQDNLLVPTDEQRELKRWLEQTLKPLLERHSGGVFHTFGSCENGFWMNGSDIDACLVLSCCTRKQSWITKLRLVQHLAEREQLGSVELVRGARVPVAKLLDAQGAGLCDVSINNVAALENSRFVAALSCLDWRVPVLGRFIKHWASQRRINNRAEGTLSTYTLILQLFYFLQKRDSPLLPSVANILVEEPGSNTGMSPTESSMKAVNALVSTAEMDETSGELRPLPFLTDPKKICGDRCPELGQNQESLGELLLGFFQLWGNEEFRGGDEGSCHTVYVYDASQEPNDLGVLVMRCPLTGKNVNPFTTTVWRAIHAEFERAALLLHQGCSLQHLCEAAEDLPAGCGHRGGGIGATLAQALVPSDPAPDSSLPAPSAAVIAEAA